MSFLLAVLTSSMACSITQRGEGGGGVRAHPAWPKLWVIFYVRLAAGRLCLVIAWDVTGSTSQGLRHMRKVTQLLIQVNL